MRLLIASASTGSGHVAAANALEAAFRLTHPDAEIQNINILDYVMPGFRRVYEDGYEFLMRRAPSVWGGLYHITDNNTLSGSGTLVLDTYQLSQAAPLFKFLEMYRPTKIIATHFLVAQLLWANRRVTHALDVVITDFRLHRIWLHPNVKRYFVAAPETGAQLLNLGVDRSRIVVSGIPIHPDFAVEHSRRRTGRSSAVVVMGGGSGVGRLEKTVAALGSASVPMHIISVAGRNEEARARVAAVPLPSHIRLTNLGFVSNMPEILAQAELIVTKAGGLTVSECLAMGVPMVLYPCLPGQESANADHVAFRGAGRRAASALDAKNAVENLLSNPPILASMKRRAEAAGRPDAAFAIARHTSSVSAIAC